MSKRFRFFPPLILSAALVMTLTNCASSPGHLQVNVSSACQHLGANVPAPEISDTTDYRQLSAEALAALNKANRQSAALRRCDRKVIDEYAKAARE